MGLISGVHHIAVKCGSCEEFEADFAFYRDVLGMPVVRTFGSGERAGAMLDCGDGSLMELSASGKTMDATGTVNHFALAVADVDACVAACRAAGRPIKIEPKDIVLGSVPPFPARIAFCIGPAGEEIEFFCEK